MEPVPSALHAKLVTTDSEGNAEEWFMKFMIPDDVDVVMNKGVRNAQGDFVWETRFIGDISLIVERKSWTDDDDPESPSKYQQHDLSVASITVDTEALFKYYQPPRPKQVRYEIKEDPKIRLMSLDTELNETLQLEWIGVWSVRPHQ